MQEVNNSQVSEIVFMTYLQPFILNNTDHQNEVSNFHRLTLYIIVTRVLYQLTITNCIPTASHNTYNTITGKYLAPSFLQYSTGKLFINNT